MSYVPDPDHLDPLGHDETPQHVSQITIQGLHPPHL